MIKKIFIGFSMFTVALTADATLNFPTNLKSSFGNPEDLSEWTVSVREGSATGSFASFFDSETAPVVNLEDTDYLLTNNSFTDGAGSSAWIISPEFEITDDTEMFSISLANCGDSDVATNNTFKVLYSLGGTEHSDFEINPALLTGTIRNRGANSISYSTQRAAITNLKGKKIRIAIVNEGNTTGFIGFTDFVVSPWYLVLDQEDSYNSLLIDSDSPIVKMSVTISTPVTAKGYTAELVTESGFVTKYVDTNKTFNIRNASSVNFTLPDDIQMKESEEKYTITFTPNFEGATPAIITGSLIKAERTFPAVALVEEVTGTWCGWCPGGIVMMDYWNEYFKGIREGYNRVIEVALHRTDPMSMTSGTYLSDFTSQVKKVGISVSDPPTVLVNRVAGGAPLQFDMKNFFKGLKSPAFLKIDRVEYYPETDEIKVNYNYVASFSAVNPGFAISAIVTENNVTGVDDAGNWDQTNYYSQYNMSQINAQFDPEIAPFFERFVQPNPDHIPSSMISYNEVARMIYPSFKGLSLKDEIKAEVPTSGELSFKMPGNISNIENVNLILVLSRQGNNDVMGADIVEAKDFAQNDVNNIFSESPEFKVNISDFIANICSAERGELSVRTADGSLIYRGEINEGYNTLSINVKGLLLFTFTTHNRQSSMKVLSK